MRDLVDELLRAKVETTLFGGERAPKLGRLALRERLGAGAMGTVFSAYDAKLERDVAVKVLHGGDAARDERLLAEARALAKLAHPNVVSVYDADEADGLVYIVMELAPGESMRTWRPKRWTHIVRAMREAGQGIAAAHAAGLVHRDIKPDHIFVGPDRVRVVDFGLARAGDDGTRAGTIEYMAPEVLAGAPSTAAADQYAFGITLRQGLDRCERVPQWVRAIADRASATDPAQRYPSMDQVVTALGRQRRYRNTLVFAGVSLALAGAAGAFALHASGSAGDDCAAGDARADGAWNATSRARVQAALGAAPWAGATVGSLDQAASSWKASYRHVCDARHAQSGALLDLRMRCLDRALDRLEAVVAESSRTLTAAERAATPVVVGELPAAIACETLTDASELTLPTDPAQHDRAVAADRALAKAWAEFALGRYRDARTAVAAVDSQLAGVTAPRLVAETLALAAAIEARIGEPASAHAALDRALLAAASANAPAIEADIWARRLRDELFAGDPAHVLEWQTFARAAAARAGRRGAEIDGIVAEAERDAGKLGEARRLLERALASDEALRPERRSVLELNLASVELASGRSDLARPILERARERVRVALGSSHPELALYDDKLAAATRARGAFGEARAIHDRSLALRTAAFGDDDRAVATSLYHRAQTALAAKDRAGARAALERALAIRKHAFGEHAKRLGEIYAALADVALAEGNRAAAHEAIAAAAIDPRIDLTARRATAGEPVAAAAIPALDAGETLSLDRAAALAVRADLLVREHQTTALAELAAAVKPRLVPELDPALAGSLRHVLEVAQQLR